MAEITEAEGKAAEATSEIEALRREVERLRVSASTRDRGLLDAILNESPHGILVCDVTGKLVLHNRSAERIWAGSASTDGIADWGKYRAYHPDGRQYEPGDWSMSRCLSRGAVVETEEIEFERFDGSRGFLLGSCAPLWNGDGTMRGAVSIFADITRFKEIERERAQLIEQLSRTLQFSELVAGILAHDLRNPLTAILTSAQLAIGRDPPENIARSLARIVSSGDRMARMIDQLLDLTRIRVGTGIGIEVRAANLAEVAAHVIDELRDARPGAKLELETVGNTDGEWDADRLAQAISNLAGNAVDHGSAGAPALIRVDGSQTDRVLLQVHNGGVVPEALLPVLFEPFKGGRKAKERAQGLGLGLHITQQIVNAHGGSVQVVSTEAAGTTVTVTLPRTAKTAATAVASHSRAPTVI